MRLHIHLLSMAPNISARFHWRFRASVPGYVKQHVRNFSLKEPLIPLPQDEVVIPIWRDGIAIRTETRSCVPSIPEPQQETITVISCIPQRISHFSIVSTATSADNLMPGRTLTSERPYTPLATTPDNAIPPRFRSSDERFHELIRIHAARVSPNEFVLRGTPRMGNWGRVEVSLWKEVMINYEFVGVVNGIYERTEDYTWYRIVTVVGTRTTLYLKVNHDEVSPFV
jgi:hypothetical protein